MCCLQNDMINITPNKHIFSDDLVIWTQDYIISECQLILMLTCRVLLILCTVLSSAGIYLTGKMTFQDTHAQNVCVVLIEIWIINQHYTHQCLDFHCNDSTMNISSKTKSDINVTILCEALPLKDETACLSDVAYDNTNSLRIFICSASESLETCHQGTRTALDVPTVTGINKDRSGILGRDFNGWAFCMIFSNVNKRHLIMSWCILRELIQTNH